MEGSRVSSYFQAETPTEIDCSVLYKKPAYTSPFCGHPSARIPTVRKQVQADGVQEGPPSTDNIVRI